MYEALMLDALRVDIDDDNACEEFLQWIDEQHQIDVISSEMAQKIYSVFCKRKNPIT